MQCETILDDADIEYKWQLSQNLFDAEVHREHENCSHIALRQIIEVILKN
jgi:hypothetical protein